MNHRTLVWATILGASLITTGVRAQSPAPTRAPQARSTVTLSPSHPSRWDVAGHVGWFGGNRTDVVDSWDDWYEAAAVGASGGLHLTPHLKFEFDGATTSTGDHYSSEIVDSSVQPFPTTRSRRDRVRATTFGAGLSYQFFENSWFHPFVGLGTEIVRERARVEYGAAFVPLPGGRPGTLIPAPAPTVETSIEARPFLNAGFKLYVTQQSFLRTDVRWTLSADGPEHVVWRGGVGVDF